MNETKQGYIPDIPNSWKIALVMLVALLFSLWSSMFNPDAPVRHTINYSQFMEQLGAGNIKSVTIKKEAVSGELRNETSIPLQEGGKPAQVKYFSTILPSFQGEKLLAQLQEKKVTISIESAEHGALWQTVLALLPWLLIIGVWLVILRRNQQIQGGPGGLFTFGASKARLYDVNKPSVTFNDVAGMENVKLELKETIEFLTDPTRFERIGAKVPKGVLLVGPPGTGKTLIARATAGEAAVPFYSISASEFVEMFVGVGASRVRDMFKKAKSTHPSIIFIDEIDAVGRTRGTGLGGGHDEREQTLNQLLSEMDGFDPHEEVIVMAATNRPDVLDPALLRPGRFDRHIVIDRPGWKERQAILKIHVRGKKLAADVDLETLAKGTPGMTGADLENLANEAALVALRQGKELVDTHDFNEAKDIILMGSVKELTISEEEKRITAYHEAGHTLVAWELPGADPIYKVSIIPRGMAMGVTQLLPGEDRHYYPRSYLMNRLSISLAGRVAEKMVYAEFSSGAQNDLKDATALAEKMVAQWGMSDKVGPMNLGRGEEHPFLGRELSAPKRYSEEMAWVMDQEIQQIIREAESTATGILKDRRHALDALAAALLKEEVLERADVERIQRDCAPQASLVQ
ncbi:ATP-dependent zinc metalloprotease FtsH [Geomonas subterranea]|uniref:ATP-dependent zinc metalloprotease FtsH n=1 Tax=Geomonas subterranea TaxID=2847989 RepID=A0ABX8LK41_9BACT|nr:ATP-dependent zinc metalloprotease FtsH [Geomonas subterranea]QXE92405.1 ATP-dependent zinc metalloprotease FtsH [Geomonas subterranea]